MADIQKKLTVYLRPDGAIDGALLSSDWFPEVPAHVFLSHSHADEDLAIILAQWLYEKFNIITFIDSCVWGYCDKLIEILDKEFCLSDDESYYRYGDRNRTTAFVHTLLSTALTKMINRCECLFFLNTPNSIIPDPRREETSSPWIYYELLQTQIIHRKKRDEDQRMYSSGGVLNEGAFKVILPADTTHLLPLSKKDLDNWADGGRYSTPEEALDNLYKSPWNPHVRQKLFS